MDKFQVFDPTTTPKEQAITFVPRPVSLRNLRIGLVENTKFNSDKLLLKIAAILEQPESNNRLTKNLWGKRRFLGHFRASIPDPYTP